MLKRMVVGGLSLTAAGLISIATWEGFKEEAYIPVPGDVPTIGFGSTEGVQMGDTISVPDALNRLEKDVRVAERCVNDSIKVAIPQKTFDSLVSFAYNIGCRQFADSTLVVKFNQGDLHGGCEEMKRWIFFKGRELDGLKKRRASEYEMCVEGLNGVEKD